MENELFRSLNAPRPVAPAVGRAVRVMEVVSSSDEPPGISEIARRTGMGKSTVHALVSALKEEGLLVQVGSARGYRLGPWLFRMSARARDQQLVTAAGPHLRDLASTEDTALVGVLVGDNVRILRVERGQKPLSLSATVGSTVPLMAGALGKAYLAGMSPSSAAAYLREHSLRQFTDRSITDPDAYADEVEAARQRGFAVERGEYLPGIQAVAASVSAAEETCFLWIVGIEAGESDESLMSRGALVREAARAIERELSGSE